MKDKFLFTVFTPTYNRAKTLSRVYDSLKQQTFKNFEWLIVDDGSTDNTQVIVQSYIKDGLIKIRYIWQPNGHKKTAMNHGVREAQGDLFLTWDSDDAAPANALEIFHKHWDAIPESERQHFAGVCGLCVDENGGLVGNKFPQEKLVSDSNELRYRYKVVGEKWGFTRTAIMREFPFPEHIKGHVPEGVVWSAIALKYKTLFINDIVRIYYSNSNESLTNSTKTLANLHANAEGHALWAASVLEHEIKWIAYKPTWFIKMAINLTRFSLHQKKYFNSPNSLLGRLLYFTLYPVGWLAYQYDLRSKVGRDA